MVIPAELRLQLTLDRIKDCDQYLSLLKDDLTRANVEHKQIIQKKIDDMLDRRLILMKQRDEEQTEANATV